MEDHALIIASACDALSDGDTDAAFEIIQRDYPFSPVATTKKSYGRPLMLEVFMRDGFIDRYFGDRLIFPPVLYVLHAINPTVFPATPGWKTDLTHPAFNALTATIDHVVPVTLGGADELSNMVTCSMARNFAKNNAPLEEIGWELQPQGELSDWDGLLGWFVDYCTGNTRLLSHSAIKKWYGPAKGCR